MEAIHLVLTLGIRIVRLVLASPQLANNYGGGKAVFVSSTATYLEAERAFWRFLGMPDCWSNWSIERKLIDGRPTRLVWVRLVNLDHPRDVIERNFLDPQLQELAWQASDKGWSRADFDHEQKLLLDRLAAKAEAEKARDDEVADERNERERMYGRGE